MNPMHTSFSGLLEWAAQLRQASALTEVIALVAAVLLAWLLVRLLRGAVRADLELPVLFGRRLVDGALFPVVLLCLGYALRAWLQAERVPLVVWRVALPVLVSLAVIRVGVKVLQWPFRKRPSFAHSSAPSPGRPGVPWSCGSRACCP